MSEDCLAHGVKGSPPSAEKQDLLSNSGLMSENAVAPGPEIADGLSSHDDARALVRLIQCPKCSRPFEVPVTLPCGHSACRECLPAPHMRLNISYPDTPDRQTGIWCPVADCKQEYPVGEVSVDVTLSKIMGIVLAEVDSARSNAGNVRTTVTLPPPRREDWPEREKPPEPKPRKMLGGRLLANFGLAELNELDYGANVTYEDPQPSEDGQRLDVALLDRLRETMVKELECQICYHTMFDPVTTSCGHTFCRRCLTRVLDHSSHCPACRRSLPIPASLLQQKSNAQIAALLQTLCSEIVAARAEAIAVEESSGTEELNVPFFVCTVSFPSMPTFLHIFEPRYRLMMRRAVESNRQFGMLISNRLRSPQGNLGTPAFCQYGTMLQIVGMQRLSDGRSVIETQGLYRFRVKASGIRDGYHIGSIEKLEDVSLVDEERLEAEEIRAYTIPPDSPLDDGATSSPSERTNSAGENLNTALLESMSTLQLFTRATEFIVYMRRISAPWLHQRILDAYGEPPSDPAIFPYWFASVLPIADEEKYLLIPTTSVRQRLKIVVLWIRRVESQRWYSGSNCTVL